ncbi:beta-defensin 106A [Cricetulus griseus]|uniref:Beta-defensin n=1 Tax=Cricetulus griseus TaxID=10029 RepID=A0A061IL49_CRIGR|nr:beta-defensin 106A [Cricetulus griseus]XP_027245826.1 beta-defensin 106A [Cricetulus griseus]ERE87751.1 beta-defensin 15-like protein [Cricetulus griseus]
MKTFFFFFAVLFFLSPAKNAFFDAKCNKLNGRCANYCKKNEELVALCQKSLKCCLTVQPCGSKGNDSAEYLAT